MTVYCRHRPNYRADFGPLEMWPTSKVLEQQLQRRSGMRDGATWTRYVDADGFATSVFGEINDGPTVQMEVWPNRAAGDAPKPDEEAEWLWSVTGNGGVLKVKLRDRAPRPLMEVLAEGFGAEVVETTSAGKVFSFT